MFPPEPHTFRLAADGGDHGSLERTPGCVRRVGNGAAERAARCSNRLARPTGSYTAYRALGEPVRASAADRCGRQRKEITMSGKDGPSPSDYRVVRTTATITPGAQDDVPTTMQTASRDGPIVAADANYMGAKAATASPSFLATATSI